MIDTVVDIPNNGLNASVDTISHVIREYNQGIDDMCTLRRALHETKSVLTAKKSGQIAMRDLWLKKKELEETVRILKDIEWLKVSSDNNSL